MHRFATIVMTLMVVDGVGQIASAETISVSASAAPVTAELLKGLPEVSARLDVHGVVHECSGPKLIDVLAVLGLPHGEALRGKALARTVEIDARDGYEVVFSLAELDPTLGNTPAIIATRCDGKPLDAKDGPYRLVVPNDQRPARSARQVKTITLSSFSK